MQWPWVILLLILSTVLFSSCYERIEGCLDMNAVNFNPLADDPCCCNYPSLNFQLQHRFGADSIRFFQDSAYLLESGISFKILSLELMADKLELTDIAGGKVEVEERIDFPDGKVMNCPCVDDVFAINLNSLNTSPGTVSQSGSYSSISLYTGLAETWSDALPSDFPQAHPLINEVRFDEERSLFHHLRATIVFPEVGDTIVFRSSNLREQIVFAGPFELKRGQNTTFRLMIDYQKWFKGLEELVSEPHLLEALLKENLASAFSVSQ